MEVPIETIVFSTLNNNRNSKVSAHSKSWERLVLKTCWQYHTRMHKPSSNLKELAQRKEYFINDAINIC
jgi:hypothetical protein